ncbi:glycosyl transferase, group 2 family protein [Thioalkalivibrio nitratireducens DSM 14787]|uniref:Glycosyl transferase, group 2 family protein n=1 Tax=Thioalkalivibrio nitratireducens (strain DSM 14787 / UNIQEM 213 / ALEN2) TaxID=1255043 RepID=L0DV03_THIND|nr:PIG-L family deacetylase [Thioalkalivibrio nitratireducens]AGA32837.1 glycosyl transferase, group 2 family protein [Thioalkalivibrio nitratireducens DSM 14787]
MWEGDILPYQALERLGEGDALVLAPHPQDEVLGCAGAILSHLEAGDTVSVVIVTNGRPLEGDDVAREAHIHLRREESEAAARVLGYGAPRFLNEPDWRLEYGERLVRLLLGLIEEKRAGWVYAPSHYEVHPDYRAMALAAMEAVRRVQRPVHLAQYEIGNPLMPNRLLDISRHIQTKRRAASCFPSQLAYQPYDRQIIDGLNCFRTCTLPKGIRAAEAYQVISADELRQERPGLYAALLRPWRPVRNQLVAADTLVSVIVRSVGRPQLVEALRSIAAQTYPWIEVVLVDAAAQGDLGSSDWVGPHPVRRVGGDRRLLRSAAANAGLDAARGAYIAFLDEDDWYEPNHIQRLVDALEEQSNVVIAYSGVRRIRTTEEGRIEDLGVFDEPFDASRLWLENIIPINAVLLRANAIRGHCRFDENLDLHEDWDFWLQCLDRGDFVRLGGSSAAYRIGAASTSGVWEDADRVQESAQRLLEKWWPKLEPAVIRHGFEIVREKLSTAHEALRESHRAAAREQEGLRGALEVSRRYTDDLLRHLNGQDTRLQAMDAALRESHRAAAREQESLREALEVSRRYADDLLRHLNGQDTRLRAIEASLRTLDQRLDHLTRSLEQLVGQHHEGHRYLVDKLAENRAEIDSIKELLDPLQRSPGRLGMGGSADSESG